MAEAKQMAASGPINGPWALPDGWRWERLGAVALTVGGGRLKFNKSHYVERGFAAFSAAGQDGFVNRWEFEGDAVVLSSIGARCGKSFYAQGRWTSLANTQCIIPGVELDARYLWYFSNNEERWERSGSAQPFIKPATIKLLPIPLPPIEVQKTVVARIDELFTEIDDGEAALARAREDLRTWRKALLKAAVTGELTADWRAANPPTETGDDLLTRILADRRKRWEAKPRKKSKKYQEPASPSASRFGNLPEGWCWATMEQLSWASGYGSSVKCTAGSDGTPVLRIPNIRGGSVNFDDIKRTAAPLEIADGTELDLGDLLIIRTNGSEDLIGRAALIMKRPNELTYFASYLIRLRLLGPIQLLRWISVLIDSPVFRAAVLRSIGSSAGQYNLNLTKIESFVLPIPPIEEVDAAISRFRSAEAEAVSGGELAEIAGMSAATLRQSILAAAFRGELA